MLKRKGRTSEISSCCQSIFIDILSIYASPLQISIRALQVGALMIIHASFVSCEQDHKIYYILVKDTLQFLKRTPKPSYQNPNPYSQSS